MKQIKQPQSSIEGKNAIRTTVFFHPPPPHFLPPPPQKKKKKRNFDLNTDKGTEFP